MMSFKMLQRRIKSRKRGPADRVPTPLDEGLGFTIRLAYPDDEAALNRLAELDSQPLPPRPLLVAEVSGELWAAVTVNRESHAIADPFHHTAALVALLRERADGLAGAGHRRAAPPSPVKVAYS